MATAVQLEKSPPLIPGIVQPGNRLAGLWGILTVRWAQMAARQRGWVIAATLMVLGVSGAVAYYALRTDWRTLYVNLDPDDQRQMAQMLSQAQIPYETTPDGAGIRVPVEQLDKARLLMAANGGVKSGRMGFELFDKPNWVGSEFDEQVNYQRALEGELERTVSTLSDVESARVHLVLPHDSLFREEERPAKGSVVLKLRHRSLAEGEPDAIRNLVASAVDGLSPDRVVLVDAAGNIPLGPRTPEAVRLDAEQAFENKVIATLEPVTGVGNVRASVTLDFHPEATDETQEIYDPEKSATLSTQRTEQTSGEQPVAAGVAGAASNAPNTGAADAAGLPASDFASAIFKDRGHHLRRDQDHAPHCAERRQRAPPDGGHRGERPAGDARDQGACRCVAAALRRRVAQPDGAGAGGPGIRHHARRRGDGGRPVL